MPIRKKTKQPETSVIAVTFPNCTWKTYHYNCNFAVDVGSHVVVDSPKNGYTVVKVVGINVTSCGASKSVVDVVDDSEYKSAIKTEADRKAIILRLEAIADQIGEMARFAPIAKSNPEAKKLLGQLKRLSV